ncbi:AT hook motif family protein [Fusarium bulbicola]|nr:AT hook motif family protein [Fusarium bulbicola]
MKKDTKGANKCRPVKTKKSVISQSRRVFYRLRGKETGEDEILPGAEAGEIDFLSDDCTKFSGVAYDLPYVDSSVEFTG